MSASGGGKSKHRRSPPHAWTLTVAGGRHRFLRETHLKTMRATGPALCPRNTHDAI
jgi:hypothetical protein